MNKMEPRDPEEFVARRSRAEKAILEDLCTRVLPMVEAARNRGFDSFYCRVNMSIHTYPMKIRFFDGKGNFFDRSLGYAKVASAHGLDPGTVDSVSIQCGLRSYILRVEGMRLVIGRNMGLSRVSLTG